MHSGIETGALALALEKAEETEADKALRKMNRAARRQLFRAHGYLTGFREKTLSQFPVGAKGRR